MDAQGAELVERTGAGIERLRASLAVLSEGDLRRTVHGGWTVAAVVAHLAFWDGWVETRWRMFAQAGSFDDLPDTIADLVNSAAEPVWLAVPGGAARDLALAAADRVHGAIRGLDARAVAAAISTNRPAMLDRTRHWDAHVAEIRQSLASS